MMSEIDLGDLMAITNEVKALQAKLAAAREQLQRAEKHLEAIASDKDMLKSARQLGIALPERVNGWPVLHEKLISRAYFEAQQTRGRGADDGRQTN